MFFIHTFSLVKNLHLKEASRLWEHYKFIKPDKNKDDIQIIQFSKKGIRINLRYRAKEAVHYDLEHKEVQAEIIVTPFKLIYEGVPVGYLKTREDYKDAVENMLMVLEDIELETNINLADATIQRVDLTLDIVTPSQIYTREIISVMKAVRLPRGFQPYEWKDMNNDWDRKDGFLYQNKGIGIKVKIYDKEKNLLSYGEEIDFLKGRGLLRFEVALEKKYLENDGYMRENYYKTMREVLRNSEWIYLDNIIKPLDHGDIFSEDLLKRFVRLKCSTKPDAFKKGIMVIEMALTAKRNEIMLKNDFIKNYDVTYRVLKKFKKWDVCPIPAISECPYIPSVSKLLKRNINEVKYNFAKKYTRGKELWSYGI